jgi:hypothetical protein
MCEAPCDTTLPSQIAAQTPSCSTQVQIVDRLVVLEGGQRRTLPHRSQVRGQYARIGLV